jgi:hypothetical protein
MNEDGVLINPTQNKFWLNEMLHIHEAAPTTFWLTYIADVGGMQANPVMAGHLLVWIEYISRAPGLPVRCIMTD